MKFFHKFFVIVFCLLFVLCFKNVKAEEDIFVVYDDATGEEVGEYDSYYLALSAYNNNLDTYENLVIKLNDDVIKMEYGIVEFKVNEGCTLNVEYYSSETDQNKEINGCYAIDAAYLGTSSNLNYVYFKISGDIGYTAIENVTLHPYDSLNVDVSIYQVKNNVLYHDIKNQLNSDYYATSLPINEAPSYLSNNQRYYSYDGHYFYRDFKSMIDDYVDYSNERAVNSEEPYYDYYQYLSHRSLTNYTASELEDYFYNTLGFDNKLNHYRDLNRDNANDEVNRSQYFDEIASFFAYQNIYGANAMMMLSLSINESAYGKSLLAFSKNNLFGSLAFDNEEERETSRYSSIEDSIYAHAKYYISNRYSNYHRETYSGSFFGNKVSGMNVDYSYDPLWGEKCASNYYKLDKELGFKDHNTNCLGIINQADRFSVFASEDRSSVLYTLKNVRDYAFIIIGDVGSLYKVQIEPSYSDEYLYDFTYSYGYVDKTVFDYLINEDNIQENEYVTITYNFDGGEFANKDYLEIKLPKGSNPTIIKPDKEGFVFVGYDKEIVPVSEEITYIAQYKEITNIEIVSEIKQTIELGTAYDLRGGELKVNYVDGSSETIPITSDMLYGLDANTSGEQDIEIRYCGFSLDDKITVSKELADLHEKLKEKISNNVTSYKENYVYNTDDLAFIKENIDKVDYDFTFEEIRYLDAMYLETTEYKYHLEDSKYEISVSGLGLALSTNDLSNGFFDDTYYLSFKNASNSSIKKIDKIASAYDFTYVDSFKVKITLNYDEVKLATPIIMQVKLEDKSKIKTYSVYHINEEGDIIKCKTTQSNAYIQFMLEEEGDYVILSLDSANTYMIKDVFENITTDNDSYDNHSFIRFVLVFAFLLAISYLGIAIYYALKARMEREWNDCKKSLLKVDYVPEEKPKN